MRVRSVDAQVFPREWPISLWGIFFNQAPLCCEMRSLCLLACDLNQSSTVSICFQLFTKRSSFPIDLSWLSGWGSTFCKNDDLFLDSHFPFFDLCLHVDTGCYLLLFCRKLWDQCFSSRQPACPIPLLFHMKYLTLTFIKRIQLHFFPPEMVSHYVIHAVSLLRAILLLQPPKSWDYRHMPPCPASLGYLFVSMTLNLWHFQSQHSSFF